MSRIMMYSTCSKLIIYTSVSMKPTLLCALSFPHDSDTLKQTCKLYVDAACNYPSTSYHTQKGIKSINLKLVDTSALQPSGPIAKEMHATSSEKIH